MTEQMPIPLAERFKAPQGEGLYSGTQMAFVRTVGCSVGQDVCTACDTAFDRIYPDQGGGRYTPSELMLWADGCRHVCITGGEPLDRDLRPLLQACVDSGVLAHVETSGTKHPAWLDGSEKAARRDRMHAIGRGSVGSEMAWSWQPLWVTVSPKPGYRPEMVEYVADEIKVIIGGLGDGPGWPTALDAVRWADSGLLVYVQPRNFENLVDEEALQHVVDLVALYPQLRLSTQLYKFVGTR